MSCDHTIYLFKIHCAEVEATTTATAELPMAELPAAKGDEHMGTEEWVRGINSDFIFGRIFEV